MLSPLVVFEVSNKKQETRCALTIVVGTKRNRAQKFAFKYRGSKKRKTEKKIS